MFGLLNIHKPPGPTSHDIVAQVRRLLGKKTKVGHAGTLDPFAEGVLVVCVGAATRLADYVQAYPKQYTAEVMLGATSSTDDVEGEITETPNAKAAGEENVREALQGFVGEVEQTPPAHSAVHLGGERAYKLARRGETPDLQPRPVTIHSIELLEYEYPALQIDVRCGSGTYIRSLARDIGSALGVGGYCSALTRTAIGPFKLKEAVSPQQLDPQRDLISPLAALERLEKIAVDEKDVRKLIKGQNIFIKDSGALRPGEEVAAVGPQGRLIAIGAIHPDQHGMRPVRVFPPRP
ncbi:MAG: tRNA pseudouridine(55) synthase TruB [Planctomycetota bacterium]|jgi:tRNA pseudouridine55 synthase